MRTMVRWGLAAGVAVGLLATGTAQAQQTFPPDTQLLAHVDGAVKRYAGRGYVSVSTYDGAFTTVRVSPQEGTRIVVPRAAWGTTVGRISAGSTRAAALRLPERPRGTIVLRARAPRVELVPTRRTYDLRISRFTSPAGEIELTFESPAGSLLRSTCPGTTSWSVAVTRTVLAPATVLSGGAC